MKAKQIIFLLVVVIIIGGLGFLNFKFYSESKINLDKFTKTSKDLNEVGTELNAVKVAYMDKSKIVDINLLAGNSTSLTYLSKCNVALNIPDSTKTFEPETASGSFRTWRLAYESDLKNPSYVGDPFIGGFGYYALLKSDLDASGYIPGLVYVMCAPNKDGYTTETLTKKYIEVILAGNKKVAKELGVSTTSLVVKDNGVLPKWGVETHSVSISKVSATDTNVENGNMFMYKDKIFYVYKVSSSSVKKTLNSMNGIFDSLLFLTK